MSLLAQLQSRGVTTEDLEKAASVRLFEKAAAAEGVNLDDLAEDQVITLFEHFVSDSTHPTKEASAMNDEIIDLFEKTAAAEGIDLDDMSDDELAELYDHYVENVLPDQLEEYDDYGDYESEKDASEEVMDLFQKTAEAEGIDLEELSVRELSDLYGHYVENVLPLQLGDEDAAEKVADAQEKLAEAEILGRHMARAYADEIDKVAEEGYSMRDYYDAAKQRGKELLTGSEFKRRRPGDSIVRTALKRGVPKTHKADVIEARKILAMRGGVGAAGAAAAGGLGYGVKRMMDRKKGSTKRASASDFDTMRAILLNAGYDV